jgi:hypothetical protein
MTNRVSGNGVTISTVKSIEGLPENALPYRHDGFSMGRSPGDRLLYQLTNLPATLHLQETSSLGLTHPGPVFLARHV